MSVSACVSNPETTLERLTAARRLSSDLRVQITKAADAANRAVMADTDEASREFAHEAEDASASVQKTSATLRQILMDLRYGAEAGLLDEFAQQFSAYRMLDQDILSLAVENTNLKAQRLSFGSAQQSADAFRDALDAVEGTASTKDRSRVDALATTAILAVREIQVLQAPHIAEAEDAAMTRFEKQMAASERVARRALDTLVSLIPLTSRPQLAAATAALDRFMSVNAEIIVLSRRNSNVRSLALSLGQKRMLTAQCDQTLRALQDSLSKRGFSGTR